MDMRHEHAARTCIDMWHGHISMNMQHRHAAWTSSMDKWTFNMNMRLDIQHVHVVWTCSKDMKQGREAGTCIMDMRHGDENLHIKK
jgi:hypothetical protein